MKENNLTELVQKLKRYITYDKNITYHYSFPIESLNNILHKDVELLPYIYDTEEISNIINKNINNMLDELWQYDIQGKANLFRYFYSEEEIIYERR